MFEDVFGKLTRRSCKTSHYTIISFLPAGLTKCTRSDGKMEKRGGSKMLPIDKAEGYRDVHNEYSNATKVDHVCVGYTVIVIVV